MGISPEHRRGLLRRAATMMAAAVACALVVGAPVEAEFATQVELDRIVARVNGRLITQSDLRQARMLKLVADTSSDETVVRALEDRLLILAEITRSAPLPPVSEADLGARRRVWEATLGGAPVSSLLSQVAMGEADVQNWLRDDVRIQRFLDRQFGTTPESDRARTISEWLTRLRARAGL